MRKNTLIICAGIALALTSCKEQQNDSPATLNNVIDSVSYGIGMNIGKNLKQQGIDSFNTKALAQAVDDIINGNPTLIDEAQANQTLNNYFQNLQAKKSEGNVQEGKDFLEANSKKEGVITLPSGLQYQVMKEGSGAQPSINDMVTTHYHGTFIDGKVFDSSVERGEPATFPVNGVIAGWTEALQLMKEGAKWKLFVPYNLAYGEQGSRGGIPPYSTLIFEVELVKVEKQAAK